MISILTHFSYLFFYGMLSKNYWWYYKKSCTVVSTYQFLQSIICWYSTVNKWRSCGYSFYKLKQLGGLSKKYLFLYIMTAHDEIKFPTKQFFSSYKQYLDIRYANCFNIHRSPSTFDALILTCITVFCS